MSMTKVTNVEYPYNRNKFHVELFEFGNAPDYSVCYAPGVQAGRGQSEGYDLDNCPKGDDTTVIDITANVGTDTMKFNYIKIDYGHTGDGVKWYFVTHKTILNYPTIITGSQQNYTVEFQLALDYWETYKDKLGTPNIQLERVTTSMPASWNDTSAYKTNVLPFSDEDRTLSDRSYSNWKPIVMWRAKKPVAQDNYIVDKLPTVYKIEGASGVQNWATELETLASEPPEATNLFRSYVGCNCYLVSDYFATADGSESKLETINVSFPGLPVVHNILKYPPYRRAFIKTIDGSCYEIDANKFPYGRLPDTVTVSVCHSTTPSPHSILYPLYAEPCPDVVCFAGYPALSVTTTTPSTVQKIIGNATNASDIMPARLKASSGMMGVL